MQAQAAALDDCDRTLQFAMGSSPRKIRDHFGVLTRIKSAGIETENLRLVVKYGDMASVELLYNNLNIGYGELVDLENQNNPGRIYIPFNGISLVDDYQGKGLGTLIYLALAKAAYVNGQIFESSYDINSSARGVWRRFVRQGLAIDLGRDQYEFKFEVLQDSKFQQGVDELLELFKLRPNEYVHPTGEVRRRP
ncbi:MAG: hypothetical protein AB7N80_06065 [Bdellovibrionales bacterium]